MENAGSPPAPPLLAPSHFMSSCCQAAVRSPGHGDTRYAAVRASHRSQRNLQVSSGRGRESRRRLARCRGRCALRSAGGHVPRASSRRVAVNDGASSRRAFPQALPGNGATMTTRRPLQSGDCDDDDGRRR